MSKYGEYEVQVYPNDSVPGAWVVRVRHPEQPVDNVANFWSEKEARTYARSWEVECRKATRRMMFGGAA